MYMNSSEIEQARQNFAKHPILSRAANTLNELMELTNQVSDGWAYWNVPCTAAKKLQELIQKASPWRRVAANEQIEGVTEKALREAYRPIKSMMTRRKKNFEGRTLTFY